MEQSLSERSLSVESAIVNPNLPVVYGVGHSDDANPPQHGLGFQS
jgi:hypothetical protein